MIRKATINDVDTMVEYNASLAKETEGIELDRDLLKKGMTATIQDPGKGHAFVYEQDGKVVAQILITNEWSDWRNKYFWWIQSVYVHKDCRRQGIFKELYEYVKDIVINDPSICGLRLYVENENKKAKKTYEEMGMHETYYLLYEWEKE